MTKEAPSEQKEMAIAQPILRAAVKDAASKADGRAVLLVTLLEAASLAKAIRKAGKFNAAELAALWGDSLSDALEDGTPAAQGPEDERIDETRMRDRDQLTKLNS